MFLVAISRKFIVNFQFNLLKRQGDPLFTREHVHLLAFKKLVDENF